MFHLESLQQKRKLLFEQYHLQCKLKEKKGLSPLAVKRVITSKWRDHLSPACSWVQNTQAWFCVAQQGGSGKENQSRYVEREEWDYCLWLVTECRILLTFGIWQRISLAAAQGLAPAFDMPGQGGVWTTLCLTHPQARTQINAHRLIL